VLGLGHLVVTVVPTIAPTFSYSNSSMSNCAASLDFKIFWIWGVTWDNQKWSYTILLDCSNCDTVPISPRPGKKVASITCGSSSSRMQFFIFSHLLIWKKLRGEHSEVNLLLLCESLYLNIVYRTITFRAITKVIIISSCRMICLTTTVVFVLCR
jgi:hypothetical protein